MWARRWWPSSTIFWLLGATDGHAKNFSVFLRPGGRFQLAPLYDVLSAQPSFDQKQMRWKQYRLAMSFGAKPHYAFRQIAPRHFAETAERAGLGRQVVPELLEELCSTTPAALECVLAKLPAAFPQKVAESIAGGIRKRLRTLEATAHSCA